MYYQTLLAPGSALPRPVTGSHQLLGRSAGEPLNLAVLRHVQQNDLMILAALSHSLSRVVGQYVSRP